jgi:hypothetical protein
VLYTVQVPVVITFEVQADSPDDAFTEAQAIWQDAVIELDCQYTLFDRWEDVQIYDAQGNLVEEEA